MAENTTEATLAAITEHMQAIFDGDLDAIVAGYAPECTLCTPDGLLQGHEAVRAFFAGMLANTPPEVFEAVEMVRQDGEGEFGYILWKAGDLIPLGTDSFIVRDGKIVTQSFASYAPPPPGA